MALLEHAFAATRVDGAEHEAVVCEAIIRALLCRRSASVDGLVARIVLDDACPAWLSIATVQFLDSSGAYAFEKLLREASSGARDGVRECAAEALLRNGLATEQEIDAFLRDPDRRVRTLATRGLADLATPSAILRLLEVAQHDEDDGSRKQAWLLLGRMGLAPATGGSS